MGRSGSHASKYSKAIVILQWESSPGTTSPCLQFWILDHGVDSRTKSLPIPTAVPRSLDELRPSGTNPASRIHLPPLLAYDGESSSILMHNLAVSQNVDLEFTRWGPGIRLSQIQAVARLFAGTPAGLSDAKYLSPPGMIRSDVWDNEGDYRTCSGLLTAMAMDNGHGIVNIKYCGRTLGQNSVLPLGINEAYKFHEQTLRVATDRVISDTASSPPMSNTPVHMRWVGRRMRYLLLMTLSQDENRANTLLSLCTIDERMVTLDVCTMKSPNEDRGLRWQVQTLKLPAQVSSVAPIVMEIGGTPYLLVFYFVKGVLHYAQMKYAGSGSFEDYVEKTPHMAVPDQKSRASTQAPTSAIRSRWSLSARLAAVPQELDPETNNDHHFEERLKDSLPLGAEGCQPYAIVANGFLWVFYVGADLNGKYVCHSVPSVIEHLNEGWDTVSWASGPLLKEHEVVEGEGISRHFIPVVVPGDFMSMY